MPQLAFYKGKYGTFWDRLICFVTKSEYSHIEAVFDHTSWSSSPRDGGVRQTKITYNDHWTLVPCPELSEKLFLQEKGKKYDWLGLLAPVFQTKVFSSKHKWFCSEIIAEALELEDSWSYSPECLYQLYKPA